MAIPKLNKQQVARQARKEAMPEVQALVKKHGRRAVLACVNSIRIWEREKSRLERMEKEVDELRKKITG